MFACDPECGCTFACSARKSVLRAVDRELLDLVDELAAAVVALARIALGVLVRQDRALRLAHGARDPVLGGDELEPGALAPLLLLDPVGDLGIDDLEIAVQQRGGGDGGRGHGVASSLNELIRPRARGTRSCSTSRSSRRCGRRCRGRTPAASGRRAPRARRPRACTSRRNRTPSSRSSVRSTSSGRRRGLSRYAPKSPASTRRAWPSWRETGNEWMMWRYTNSRSSA